MKKENSFLFLKRNREIFKGALTPSSALYEPEANQPRRARQYWLKDLGFQLHFFFSCHANQGETWHSSHIRLGRGLPLKGYASIFILLGLKFLKNRFSSFTFWENDPLHFWGLRINPVQKSHRRNRNSNINKSRKLQAFTSKALNFGTTTTGKGWQINFLFFQSTDIQFNICLHGNHLDPLPHITKVAIQLDWSQLSFHNSAMVQNHVCFVWV